MSFWRLDAAPADAIALRAGSGAADERIVSYGALASLADAGRQVLGPSPSRRLGLIRCRATVETVAAWLGALRAGDAAILVDERLPQAFMAALLQAWQPDWIHEPADRAIASGYRHVDRAASPADAGWRYLLRDRPAQVPPLHPDLAMLLSTSGTTGSPKMVRLSHANLSSNAASIVEYLGIAPDDRGGLGLPLAYAFGLSVLHSHLQAGACTVLQPHAVSMRPFWDGIAHHRVDSLAGVPSTYQMLRRLDPDGRRLGALRTLTQAGGRLPRALVDHYRALCERNGARFYVMYGQTEAAPRIAWLPPHWLADKPDSIGIAVPGGRLSLSGEGELIYRGPNVMMGYAECRTDLVQGDTLGGTLFTGDLAEVDPDGCFTLVGRLKRFVKLHGNRINLDEVERLLEACVAGAVAVTGDDQRLRVFVEAGVDLDTIRQALVGTLRLHASCFDLDHLERIPTDMRGKKHYAALPA